MIKSDETCGIVRDFVKPAFETYFQMRDEPMFAGHRFLCALAGAYTLFLSAVVIHGSDLTNIFDLIDHFELALFLLGGISVLSFFFGFIISTARTRHGPVRLYLSGLLLPAFVVFVVRATWSVN